MAFFKKTMEPYSFVLDSGSFMMNGS